LDKDERLWPRNALLIAPHSLAQIIYKFRDILLKIKSGDQTEAFEELAKLPSEELRSYYREHAIWAYKTRAKISTPKNLISYKGKRMPSDEEKKIIFDRDGYTCQYCGIPVVSSENFKKASLLIGSNYFSVEKSDRRAHGVKLMFSATWDHVVPFRISGNSGLTNLVTCCWGCNFGKYEFSLEDLGLDDPRKNPKRGSQEWTGLNDIFTIKI
jgi:5-methylcytosine-specific restriction endonuclease McrA